MRLFELVFLLFIGTWLICSIIAAPLGTIIIAYGIYLVTINVKENE